MGEENTELTNTVVRSKCFIKQRGQITEDRAAWGNHWGEKRKNAA